MRLWNTLDVSAAIEKYLAVTSSNSVFAATIEKYLELTTSGLLTFTGIAGYSVFIAFMMKNPNTSKRIINVLNGQYALTEMLMAAVVFASQREKFGYDQESILYLVLSQGRVFLGFFESIILFWIAVVTLMKKFLPEDYLNFSEKWTFQTSMRDFFIILMIHVIITGICFAAGNFQLSFHMKIQVPIYCIIYLILFSLTLIIQVRLVIVENKKSVGLKMRKLLAKNTVTPADVDGEPAAPEDTEEEEDEDNEEIESQVSMLYE